MGVSQIFQVTHHSPDDDCTTARRWLGAGAMLAVLALAACSSPDEVAKGVEGEAKARASAAPADRAAAPGPVTFTDNQGKDEAAREFSYSWPAEVSAVPALVRHLTAERDRLLAEQKAEWAEAVAEFAGEDCVACTNRAFEKRWEVVADLPRFLSLSATFYAYSGGAHGNGAFDALVWDREAQALFDPKALFRSEAALQEALGAPWCKALRAERMQRLGADYSEDSTFPCPAIADLTVLVGSSDKRRFDRIGLLAAPYVAGSYAEGSYEVTLPVSQAVLDAVKPEYRRAFAPPK
ncbi:MAG: PdaC/SigV domain-containing protein [Erythrobacter sp.]